MALLQAKTWIPGIHKPYYSPAFNKCKKVVYLPSHQIKSWNLQFSQLLQRFAKILHNIKKNKNKNMKILEKLGVKYDRL